jgi:DNA topoisomerase-1
MGKSLVIVESPTKAKTISKFLSKDYIVVSSMGHVRDLPSSAKEVPAKYKKEKWANLGVDIENSFAPLYVIPDKKKKLINELKAKLKDAKEVILATDEDREGEAISWHLLDVLKPKVPVKRMVFHEITKEALAKALDNFREVDMNLVNAQEGRRILDRLVGYTVSPVLWKKVAPKLSAGRVQSAALKLVCDRERLRMGFKTATYADMLADFEFEKQKFSAQLWTVGADRIAGSADFDRETGELIAKKNLRLLSFEEVLELKTDLEKADYSVLGVESKQQLRSPSPPFTTSTLQQEASKKLGLSAKETMRIAQKLYENGLITYMRTDSLHLSEQAIKAARSHVEKSFGKDYLSKDVRRYKTKSKGAQEAHEAIRPAGSNFVFPNKAGLMGKELGLYDLIFKRTVATQMAEARLKLTTVKIKAAATVAAEFVARGKVVEFPGFFRAYAGVVDDKDEDGGLLPDLKEGDVLKLNELSEQLHQTKPPARYTEASLIKALEAHGIGRPSTYASIMTTIEERAYVRRAGQALVPTFTGMAVTQFLEGNFPDLVSLDFTATMEQSLDEIAEGEREMLKYLQGYFLTDKGLLHQCDLVSARVDGENPRQLKLATLPPDYEIFVGRFGPYLKAKKDGEDVNVSVPETYAPADLTEEMLVELLKMASSGEGGNEGVYLGVDPNSGLGVYLKVGRFGTYLQLGKDSDYDGEKPKRATLPKQINAADLSLVEALDWLSLPKKLGIDPATGADVVAGLGRFGPYLVLNGEYRSLKGLEELFSIDLEEALKRLAEPKATRGGRFGAAKAATPGKILGEMPVNPRSKSKAKPEVIELKSGRYGAYLKYGKTNVAIPKSLDSDKITLEEAVELVKAKLGK